MNATIENPHSALRTPQLVDTSSGITELRQASRRRGNEALPKLRLVDRIVTAAIIGCLLGYAGIIIYIVRYHLY